MISDELRKYLAAEIKRGTALRQIERDTGLQVSNLSRFLSGERPPSGRMINLLSKRLGLSLTNGKRR
jgi:transcriptional regulator with XRE-family HTH domain